MYLPHASTEWCCRDGVRVVLDKNNEDCAPTFSRPIEPHEELLHAIVDKIDLIVGHEPIAGSISFEADELEVKPRTSS
jgi:hypothetical protein